MDRTAKANLSGAEQTPSLRPATPTDDSLGAQAMQQRIAARLFPALDQARGEIPAPLAIGRFEILRRVGAGGMGIVYLAHDRKLDRNVALKLLRRRAAGTDHGPLLAEARALAKLSHPNVVQVYEVEVHDDEVLLVMEFVDGETLHAWQQQKRSRAEILDVYQQVALGLAASHACGLVHRDVKPSNVLLGFDGRVRVVDFGLAFLIDPQNVPSESENQNQSTASRSMVGTPGYVAPELLLGEHASAASDQFGFCVALWEALAGERPFASEELVAELAHGRLPGPRGLVQPPWLRRVLLRGFEFAPERRWPTMSVLVARLERGRRARRWAMVFAPASTLVGALVVVSLQPAAKPCPDPEALERLWGQPQSFALLHAAGDDLGARASARVADAELTRYANLWSATQRELCESHYDRGALSAEGFDLGQRCLDDLLSRAATTIERLAEPEWAAHAEELTAALVSPRTCMNVDAGRDGTPLVAVVERFDIERTLASIDLNLAAGEHEQARTLAEAKLRGLPDDSTQLVNVLIRLGLAERQLGRLESARNRLERAALEAERIDDPRGRFVALCEYAELEAYEFERSETAKLAMSFARAPLQALGEPPELRARAATSTAMIAEIEGRHTDAEHSLREALALLDELAAAPAQLAALRLRLANSLANQDRNDEALLAYRELLEDQHERLGPDHPSLGALYFDIGMTWSSLERWTDARALLEQALTIHTRSHGLSSPRAAQVLTALADVQTELGEHQSAIELAEQAVAIQSATLPVDHPERDAGLATLAWALLQAGQLPRSLTVHEQLLAQLTPAWEAERPGLHGTIAWLLCRTNDCVGAWPHVDQALAADEPSVRVHARALEVELHLDGGALELAGVAMDKFESECDALAPDQVDERLDAERAWLRARLGMVTPTADDIRTELLARALAAREWLQPDQISDLN